MFESIDHVILAVRDLDEAAEPFERLGLTLSPHASHGGAGTANRVFFTGGESNHFYVELLTVEDEAAARAAGGRDYLLEALGREPALARVMFETADIAGVASAGEGAPYEVHRADGSKIADVRALAAGAGFGAGAIQYTTPGAERYAARKGRGLFGSEFVLKRMDHLAVMAPELDATTKHWVDVLGVPLFGEISNDVLVIKQLKIGDAMIELLGPASPDSPLAARAPGLSSMVAFEVDDLDAAVEQARARGFDVPDGRDGILPGTRVASIAANQLSGLTLQLLEYI